MSTDTPREAYGGLGVPTRRGSEHGSRWSPTGVEELTRSGEMISLLAPRIEQIYMRDIAAHLAAQVRFNGACPLLPTIAQHSLAVEYIAQQLAYPIAARSSGWTDEAFHRLARASLMHDAAEYLVGDAIGAIKKLMRDKMFAGVGLSSFDIIEDRIQTAIVKRFDCSGEGWGDIIHEADCIACAYEMAWGGWCPAAKPPAWAIESRELLRCYRPRIMDDFHDGGERAFVERAAQLGMRDR